MLRTAGPSQCGKYGDFWERWKCHYLINFEFRGVSFGILSGADFRGELAGIWLLMRGRIRTDLV